MSLDVYLTVSPLREAAERVAKAWVDYYTLARAGALGRVGDAASVLNQSLADDPRDDSHIVFSDNTTHNLGQMAEEAGLYRYVWCPEEVDVRRARDLAPRLRNGLAALKASPERFKALAPANGWGTYEGFVAFVERYLAACEKHPEAYVSVSR